MRRKLYFVIVIITLIVLAFQLQSSVKPESKIPDTKSITKEYNPINEIKTILPRFDSLLEQNLETSNTVGAAAVISYKGKIAFLKCYGHRKAGEKDTVNKNTIFRLASVSKTITGVLAGILNDENIINLDDKVIDYLPDFELKNPKNTRQLTVRNLLSHTSGLIPHSFDLMVEDKIPLNKIIARLKEVDDIALPGQIYGYQNVVYSIYSPVVKAKTQESFQQVMKEKVFVPFGMNDASLSYEAFRNNSNKAYPHRNCGNNHYRPLPLNDRYYITAPAAGVNASISDLGNFLATLTNQNSEIFTPEIQKTIFTPQIKTPLKRVYFRSWGNGIKSKSYAIGWRMVDYKGHQVAYHGGYVTGYKAEIAVCEKENIGIAILSNSPNRETAKNIPVFLNMLFKYKDSPMAGI